MKVWKWEGPTQPPTVCSHCRTSIHEWENLWLVREAPPRALVLFWLHEKCVEPFTILMMRDALTA